MPDETIATSPEVETLTSQAPPKSIDPWWAIAAFLSAALVGCFFLPWFQLFGLRMTAFQLQTASPDAKILWALPAFASVCFLAAIIKHRIKAAERFTALLPFLGLAYNIYESGIDFVHHLDIGFYLILLVSAALFFLPAKR